jgi:energy-coupling factor transporter ATP-binding protein EcfA2
MIRQGERVLAVGTTGTGKSQALAYLFAKHDGQRLLIDVQDHYELGPAAAEDACEARSPREIDWQARTIRYVPRTLSQREYNDLYAAIFKRGNLLVWLDEAVGPTSAHSAPVNLRRAVTQGRKIGITHLAASQRPAGIERTIVNQSEHAFVFLTSDPDDLDVLSIRLGLKARELATAWSDAGDVDRLWQAGYLYHRLGSSEIRRMPPLPADRIDEARRHVVIPS